MHRPRPGFFLAFLLVLVLSLALAACGGDDNSAATSTPAPSGSSNRDATPPPSDTVDLVKELSPSVVHVGTGEGVGTGFIIDEDGHIVTNNHVVTNGGLEPAQNITVTLSDGRALPVEIVGRDPRTDIAVLRINADNLTPATLGNSSDLQVGQDVVAMGNALDLPGGPTVTKGVVSALFRVIEEEDTSIPDAIQTDAAINPGNSGGPLVLMNGAVIGITTAVIRGNAEGIGLAISIDLAKPIVEELIANGEIDRGFLGVNIAPLSSQAAVNCGVEEVSGVLIAGVSSGSPADDAGLQQCDVIIELGGDEIANAGNLFQALTKNKPGQTVEVTYIRDGNEETASVTLASANAAQ